MNRSLPLCFLGKLKMVKTGWGVGGAEMKAPVENAAKVVLRCCLKTSGNFTVDFTVFSGPQGQVFNLTCASIFPEGRAADTGAGGGGLALVGRGTQGTEVSA